jgi:CBS domain-containing protein
VAGKVDWLARGLPAEGERAGETRVGELARDDVVTCRLDETVGELRPRIEASPYGFALVVADDGATLLGRLRRSALDCDDDLTAEAVMAPGPSTVRCDLSIDELRERLDKRDLRTAVVSTPEGQLIGVVRRRDLD